MTQTQSCPCGHRRCEECGNECCECGDLLPLRTVADRLAQHEHVEIIEGVLGGVEPLVSRTRISVHHILSYLYNGESIEHIAETYRLRSEAIKDAIAFVQDVYDDAVAASLRSDS